MKHISISRCELCRDLTLDELAVKFDAERRTDSSRHHIDTVSWPAWASGLARAFDEAIKARGFEGGRASGCWRTIGAIRSPA